MFTDDELEAFAFNHITYEVSMLCGTALWLQAESYGPEVDGVDPMVVHHSVLEALLVHARLLDGFLGASARKDDIVARHYNPEWEPVRPLDALDLSAPPEATALRDDINGHVAHLAMRREHARRLWPTGEIVLTTVKTMRTFVRGLDPRWHAAFAEADHIIEGYVDRAAADAQVLMSVYHT